jgi:hypothetical protein
MQRDDILGGDSRWGRCTMMVVPLDETSLLLVLQIDHSRVAGLLAAHWGNEEFAALQPYESMVFAAQEHDGGWWEWEIKPTLNHEGYPVDYIGSNGVLGSVWLDFYRRGIERVAEHDPYAGYIVSMHGQGLLHDSFGLVPKRREMSAAREVQEFVQEQEQLRDRLRSQISNHAGLASDEQIWTNFKYMEVFDQMAQFICNRYPFNSTARKNGPTNMLNNVPVPVRPGIPDTTLLVDVQDETRAIVRPYPFDLDPLEVSFPARLVANRPYSDQDDFVRHFYGAKQITITYTLHAS